MAINSTEMNRPAAGGSERRQQALPFLLLLLILLLSPLIYDLTQRL